MTLLRFWIFFSALVLITSLIAHLSTFFLDPMQTIPGIFVLHVAIFPPFIAAIVYAKKLEPLNLNQEAVLKFAPRWMQLATGAFFAYALVNFAIFFILMLGGSPEQRDGKYVLANHQHIIRQISEAEFHRRQAYIVRGFSGHWMLFSSAAMTLLTGVYHYRQNGARPYQPVKFPPYSNG